MPGAPYRNRKHPKSLDRPALHSGIASFSTVKRVDTEVEEELDGKVKERTGRSTPDLLPKWRLLLVIVSIHLLPPLPQQTGLVELQNKIRPFAPVKGRMNERPSYNPFHYKLLCQTIYSPLGMLLAVCRSMLKS